jgi:hypothetical protein
VDAPPTGAAGENLSTLTLDVTGNGLPESLHVALSALHNLRVLNLDLELHRGSPFSPLHLPPLPCWILPSLQRLVLRVFLGSQPNHPPDVLLHALCFLFSHWMQRPYVGSLTVEVHREGAPLDRKRHV